MAARLLETNEPTEDVLIELMLDGYVAYLSSTLLVDKGYSISNSSPLVAVDNAIMFIGIGQYHLDAMDAAIKILRAKKPPKGAEVLHTPGVCHTAYFCFRGDQLLFEFNPANKTLTLCYTEDR